ncbi:MAG TPA: saccharopine dehydrogenase NADP-binding domain-containing protein [Thermoplasmata archaeon]|jgi:saccharopine dehydrogenase-like NADP-dependent oxidoreductase
MKVVVLGAGAIGSLTASLLANSEHVEELVVASRRLAPARALVKKISKKHVRAKQLDCGRVGDMTKAFRGFDMVVNLVLPRFNLKIMDACVKAGVHYMDTATDLVLTKDKKGDKIERTPEQIQLDRDEVWKDHDLTAMLGWGCDPGLSNIFARLGADRLDRVDSILVRDGDNSTIEGYEFATLWSADTLIEEVQMDALAFYDGKFTRVGTAEGEEVFDFPPPVGPQTVYNVDHEESNTLPLFIGKGLRNQDFKLSLPKEFAEFVRLAKKWGLTKAEPIEVRSKFRNTTTKVAPRDVLTALLPAPVEMGANVHGATCVGSLVKGLKNGRPAGWFIYTLMDHQDCYKKYGYNAVSFTTGAPPVVGFEMFARHEIPRRGVFPPEVLDPVSIVKHLPDWGIPYGERPEA